MSYMPKDCVYQITVGRGQIYMGLTLQSHIFHRTNVSGQLQALLDGQQLLQQIATAYQGVRAATLNIQLFLWLTNTAGPHWIQQVSPSWTVCRPPLMLSADKSD